MTYFLCADRIFLNESILIEDEEARHILSSRRIKAGEVIELQDPQGFRFLTKIVSTNKKTVTAIAHKRLKTPAVSDLSIRLYQALLKEKAVDLIIQKVTELGGQELVFFESRFSQRFANSRQQEAALRRWQKIAWEACKQSGRVFPPRIIFAGSLKDVFDQREKAKDKVPASFCFLPEGKLLCKEHLSGIDKTVDLFIGPEGGFDNKEIDNNTIQPLGLGLRILRADTAAILAVGIFQTLMGDVGSFSFKD